MKNVLVRDGRGMRPMLAVLRRYEVGEVDQYGRGRWIKESDLPAILDGMKADPGRIQGGREEWDLIVPGTNIHNSVEYTEFKELFE